LKGGGGVLVGIVGIVCAGILFVPLVDVADEFGGGAPTGGLQLPKS
jgi:hypothetical protein